MYCDNGYCVTNVQTELRYFYLTRFRIETIECEAYEVNIISENKNHKIIVNERTLSACMSKDYYCKLKNAKIIWEDEIVHEC